MSAGQSSSTFWGSLTIDRYKPEVPVSFLTDEMAFENDQECAGFICDHGGEGLLESRSEGEPVFLSGKAGPLFESHRAAAFRKVDLKGQL